MNYQRVPACDRAAHILRRVWWRGALDLLASNLATAGALCRAHDEGSEPGSQDEQADLPARLRKDCTMTTTTQDPIELAREYLSGRSVKRAAIDRSRVAGEE